MNQEANTYFKYELAQKYNVSYNTFISWLKRAGIYEQMKYTRVLTPNQVKLITEIIGEFET